MTTTPLRLSAPVAIESERTLGNSRLTAATGGVLLGVLLAQLTTVVFGVRQHISWHIFLGVSASVLVALKATSTGYRFSRYYRRDPDYVAAGPPAPLMRVLSPMLLLVTSLLLGTGLLLISLGPQHSGPIRGLHGLLVWPWLALFLVHLTVYLPRLARLLRPLLSLRNARPDRRAPSRLRSPLGPVVAAIAVAVVVGILTRSLATPWSHDDREQHHRTSASISSGH